jgi:hypothetical protein
MAQKPTGSGKTEISSSFSYTSVFNALLYNFDFDDMHDPTVKSDHTHFLDVHVLPLLVGKPAHIWLQGTASKIGTDDYNMRLSKHRATKVAEYLISKGVAREQVHLDYVGERASASQLDDDERDRGVEILVMQQYIPTPQPKPQPKTNTQFKIRLLGNIGTSLLVVERDLCFFQIWDSANSLTTFYVYLGNGLTVPLAEILEILLPPLSVTLKGPWNDFVTSKAVQTTDFEGPANFDTAGIWPLSHTELELFPPSIKPLHLTLETGTTVGISLSTSSGVFAIMRGVEGKDPFPWPFTGP